MQVLLAYDRWCFARIQRLLVWLEEWFSLSQKTVEQAIIIFYLFLVILSCFRLNLIFNCFIGLLLAATMWFLHLRPIETRYASQKSIASAMLRLALQFWAIILDFLILSKPPHDWQDIPNALAQILYIVFFYMIDICSWGQKGRRRKLALAELKKMFGATWIPKPVPVPE